MELQDLLKSKITTWFLVVLLLAGFVGFGRVYLQKRQIDKEIAKLQEQANRIASDNEELSYLVRYFNTPEYQERQAREKLNLKKDGEMVVGLPDEIVEAPTGANASGSAKNNTKEWFNYFFSQK